MARKKSTKRPVKHTKESFTVEDIARLAPGAGIEGVRLDLLNASISTGYAALAERFDVEIGTVKSRLARMRSLLSAEKAKESAR